MNEREFFEARRKAEKHLPARDPALPGDRLDYNRTRSHLPQPTQHLVRARVCGELWTRRAGREACRSRSEEAAAAFEKHGRERKVPLSTCRWKRKGQFFSGGKMVLEQAVGEFLWFILFDALHHRGQLSTYIRPMGGKVPAIYGPSGDSRS